MNKGVWIFIFAFLIFASFSVSAKDYHWEEISTHVYLKENGNADVTEIQTFNFSGEYTYAFRYFHFDEIKEVRNFRVYDENRQEYPIEESTKGQYKVFKWFYTAKDEKKTFILNYTLLGPVKQGLFQDKVFWTGVFKDHEKVVKNATIYINFYNYDKEKINYRVYPNAESYLENSTLVIKTISPLEPYIPLETIITAPAGVLAPERWYFFVAKIFLILLNSLFVPYILFKCKKEYELSGKELNIKFTQEDSRGLRDLRPAIAGLLIKGHVGTQDVFATITDLAQRGYIHVQVIKKFFSEDFELLRLRNHRDVLLDYEKMILRMLFKRRDKILISKLKDNPDIKEQIDNILDEIYKEASRQKLYEKNPRDAKSKYQKKSVLYFLISAFGMSWIMLATFDLTEKISFLFHTFWWPFFFVTTIFVLKELQKGSFKNKLIKFDKNYFEKNQLVYVSLILITAIFVLMIQEGTIPLMGISIGAGLFSGFIILLYSKLMDKKTEKGILNLQKYKELRNWMKKYPLREERMFNEFLPYSIVFGIHKQWLKKFEKSIANERNKELSWYGGYSGSFSSSFSSFSSLSSLRSFSSLSSSSKSSSTSFGSHSGSGGGFGGSSGGSSGGGGGGGGSGGGGGGAG